ncbi:MAG: hypothetical protein HRU12_20445 [Phaeodactylibacter sp.]|nr:hypothetical protein [Phaeodactylibacter sp.]
MFLNLGGADTDYPFVNQLKSAEYRKVGTTIEDIEIYKWFADIRREGHEYEWYLNVDVTDDPSGIPGQGVDNPYSDFGKHLITLAGGKYFDPSYGTVFNSLKEWEDNSVDAFFFLQVVESPQNQEEKSFYLRIRPNYDQVEDMVD